MTYDYECSHCGKSWETQQSITAPALTYCPYCGKDGAHRVVLQAPSVQLRGWGWAASGYDKTRTSTK